MIALFIGGDLVASKTNYKYGETVSASIWSMEKFWVVRALVGAFVLYMAGHLTLHWPL